MTVQHNLFLGCRLSLFISFYHLTLRVFRHKIPHTIVWTVFQGRISHSVYIIWKQRPAYQEFSESPPLLPSAGRHFNMYVKTLWFSRFLCRKHLVLFDQVLRFLTPEICNVTGLSSFFFLYGWMFLFFLTGLISHSSEISLYRKSMLLFLQ